MGMAFTVFISGIVGVTAGMTLLYASLKLTALIIDKLETSTSLKQ